MASDFETPLTPPAAVPVQPISSTSEPQVPLAPQFAQQYAPQAAPQYPGSSAGTYFGASAYPAPQQVIINAYPQGAYVQPANGMAIGSFITGLLGMFPVAIPLGIVALNRMNKTGESNRWMAITGIALGAAHAIGWGLLVAIPLLFIGY